MKKLGKRIKLRGCWEEEGGAGGGEGKREGGGTRRAGSTDVTSKMQKKQQMNMPCRKKVLPCGRVKISNMV